MIRKHFLLYYQCWKNSCAISYFLWKNNRKFKRTAFTWDFGGII